MRKGYLMKKVVVLLSVLLLVACNDPKEEQKIKITDQGTGSDKTMALIEKRKQMQHEEEQRISEENAKKLESFIKSLEGDK